VAPVQGQVEKRLAIHPHSLQPPPDLCHVQTEKLLHFASQCLDEKSPEKSDGERAAGPGDCEIHPPVLSVSEARLVRSCPALKCPSPPERDLC
jgi:hypothetical protein